MVFRTNYVFSTLITLVVLIYPQSSVVAQTYTAAQPYSSGVGVQYIPEQSSVPKVITTAGAANPQQQVTELPKTGLPLVAWGLAALLPMGFKLKSKKVFKNNNLANSTWEERQFKL